MDKRVFIIVLDGFGMGSLPDAVFFGDEGANTLRSVSRSSYFYVPVMQSLGLFNIEGADILEKAKNPSAAFARMAEKSAGKDTTVGHWEIAGLISDTPMPTFPNGFPRSLIDEFESQVGRGVLCNKPYSGTEVLKDFGEEHIKTGKLIVYTSADSVFQIAAHEEIVPPDELYVLCKKARELLIGEYAVGRVIARPFLGSAGAFVRTSNRHDFSLAPPGDTLLDLLRSAGYETIGVGKIYDIFTGKGLSDSIPARSNADGMSVTSVLLQREFYGLAFVNLVEFDMLYGHRKDVNGFAKALAEFDVWLGGFLKGMKDNDVLFITADHGCDPGYAVSTDHTREYVPLLICGKTVKPGINLKTRRSFADISATVLDYFDVANSIGGESFAGEVFV